MDKIQILCDKITDQQRERLKNEGLGCQANLDNALAHYHVGKKYTRSGKYMIDNITGVIYGIKGYGVINKRRQYGTIDTIDLYYWGDYTAVEIAEISAS